MERFTRGYDRAVTIVNKVYLCLAVLSLGVVIVAMFTQVFTRYVMNAALTGSEELARYCFIWFNFLGASICVSKGSNTVVGFLSERLRGDAKKWHTIVTELTMMIFAVILLQYSIRMVGVGMRQVSPALRMPMVAVYLAMPVSAAGIILNVANNVLALLTGKPFPAPTGAIRGSDQ